MLCPNSNFKAFTDCEIIALFLFKEKIILCSHKALLISSSLISTIFCDDSIWAHTFGSRLCRQYSYILSKVHYAHWLLSITWKNICDLVDWRDGNISRRIPFFFIFFVFFRITVTVLTPDALCLRLDNFNFWHCFIFFCW